MKGKSSNTDQYGQDKSNLLDACLAQQEVKPCPPADRQEADGQGAYAQLSNAACGSDDTGSMALSVTRHASNPPAEEFQFLLRGIDSLDLGLYVIWGPDWKRCLQSLNKKKQEAREKGGMTIGLPSRRVCIFRPGGKGENYRFHLQFEAYNVFIGKAARPGSSPNVYISIAAKTLWLKGIDTALSWIAEDLKAIGGGSIRLVKVSRVDLCADFWIPGGLSYEFLLSHKVTRNDKGKLFLHKNEMETYYAADAKSPIQLRIYNKGLEVKQGGTKLWFLDLWQRESTEDIWRIEFQVRRPALKQFSINSIDDLKGKQAGLWDYLTAQWFSLRLPDNEKAERRTLHPFWWAVQGTFKKNSTDSEVKRMYRSATNNPCGWAEAVSPEWHLSHIDGCLSSFAALLGITNRDEALRALKNRLARRNNDKDFKIACIKKAIQRGTLSDGGGR